MPRVFVPQEPSRFDAASKLWIPTINLAPAQKFGEVIVMIPPGASRLHTAPLVQVLKDRMADYAEDDCVVAVGDPSLIAAAACIAARKAGGLLRMLKWDRQLSEYLSVELRV